MFGTSIVQPVKFSVKCRHGKYSKYIRMELLLNTRPFAYRAQGSGFIKLLMLNSTDRTLNFNMLKNNDSSYLKTLRCSIYSANKC